jgi:hypothetical protein
MVMSRKRSATLSSDTKAIETYIEKDTTPDYYSPPNKTYWPGALLGIVAGASYPVYFFGKLILQAHPTQSAWNVLIDQGFIYLVAAAAVVPAYIGAKVFELVLGGLFQKHNRK